MLEAATAGTDRWLAICQNVIDAVVIVHGILKRRVVPDFFDNVRGAEAGLAHRNSRPLSEPVERAITCVVEDRRGDHLHLAGIDTRLNQRLGDIKVRAHRKHPINRPIEPAVYRGVGRQPFDGRRDRRPLAAGV